MSTWGTWADSARSALSTADAAASSRMVVRAPAGGFDPRRSDQGRQGGPVAGKTATALEASLSGRNVMVSAMQPRWPRSYDNVRGRRRTSIPDRDGHTRPHRAWAAPRRVTPVAGRIPVVLRLEGALRDIQDATASLDEMTAAQDADAYHRSFHRCLGYIRGAQWKIQTAVKTAARQEPGRARLERAAAWWAAQAENIDKDPLLRWARDARDDAIHVAGGAVALEISVLRPPSAHLGNPIPEQQQRPDALLSMCIAHCGDLYDRATRAWS